MKSCQLTLLLSLMLNVVPLRMALAKQPPMTNSSVFEVYSVTVNGVDLKYGGGNEISLGSNPKNIVFRCGVVENVTHRPVRIQCKLEGIDKNWNVGSGEMTVAVLFSDDAGDVVDRKTFTVHGDSSGWKGNLIDSTFTHRREVLKVPPKAVQAQLIISSAGPQSATGIYVVDNFIISRLIKPTGKFQVLAQTPSFNSMAGTTPADWSPEGDHPSMATVVDIGSDPKTKALAIIDNDPLGHADWHFRQMLPPDVTSNDQIVVEWNEFYSIGESGSPAITYKSLPPGNFTFRIAQADTFGHLIGTEKDLIVRVPLAVWKQPSFWVLTGVCVIAFIIGGVRYVARKKLKSAMFKLEQLRALERERLRIARDIHDDLGARVTQISLLSALAESDFTFSESARTKFNQISTLSRELVSALYETVWAVNPENDNLDAMINYICGRINEICDQANLKCRLHISNMPKEVEVPSRARHNINMVVKEAMNNIIKHANASQVTVNVSCVNDMLSLSIQDNGKGFDTNTTAPGNGLANMIERIQELGGTCSVTGKPGAGTIVDLHFNIKSVRSNSFHEEERIED